MARPERHDADYFPFYAKDGRTLFILEDKYQCKGTGFFTNVMRFLTLQSDHHFCIKDEADKLYFFSKTKCDCESGMEMLNIMAKTGKIHRQLWVSYEVIISQDHLDSLSDAYRNRKNPIITIDEVFKRYVSDTENPQEDGVSSVDNPQEPVVSDTENPQRKGKETKGNIISDFYTTKKRKKISGWQLQSFNQFWNTFDDKNGKAEAGDSWLDLKVTEDLLPLIIAGAERYKIKRAEIVRKNGTPKMAQGWLSAKRWEDGGEVLKPRVVKDPTICPKCQRECDELIGVRPGVELCPSCFRQAEPEVPGKIKAMMQNIGKEM